MTKKFKIPEELCTEMHRRFLVMNSYKALISILAREYSASPSRALEDMVEKYRALYQISLMEFTVIRDAFLASCGEEMPLKYELDFIKMEAICTW